MPIFPHVASTLLALVAAAATALAPDAAGAEDQSKKLVEAYNRSGFDLFGKLAAKPGNLVVSPYSIGTAMAMTLAGARGDTQAQMAQVLNHKLSGDEIADANKGVKAAMTGPPADPETMIVIANALHLTGRTGTVAESYKKLLREKFAAELFTDSDLSAINNWVSQKTDGKITSILSTLDPQSKCVILNAVYFRGVWATAFDKNKTAPAAFHLSRSETVDVPTMRQRGAYRGMSTPEFDAVALPYKGGRLTMVVLLPKNMADAGQVRISVGDKTASTVMLQLQAAKPESLELSLPKFKMEFGANLIPPFEELGMKLAFDRDNADFTGITGSENEADRIHISQIRHKAYIEVNEAGTEAGAATAAEFSTRSATPSEAFKIDRPFVYLIVDEASGAILFMGRVTDPRG
jgi:serpin B